MREHRMTAPILRAAFAALPLLALLLLPGCCGSSERGAGAGAPLRAFTVELSSGGGVSNMHAGHIIHDDGSVLFWQGMNGRHETMRTIGAAPRERVAALKQAVDAAAVATLACRATGNMTTTLRVTDGDATTVLTWAGTAADADAVPAELRALHRLITDIVTAAEHGGEH
jgi:hypothetical protein